MSAKLLTKFGRTSLNFINNIPANRVKKRLVKKFASKIGLVYFGTVDQHKDDHRVIRGFTISSTHRDSYYCVGSLDGYDIALVDRDDVISKPNETVVNYNLFITAIDLHTKLNVPHLFIGLNNHHTPVYDMLFSNFPILTPVTLGTFERYDIEFTSRFTIYTQPSNVIEIEHLFPASTTRVMSAHLWPFSAEVKDGVLYVYSDDKHLTQNTLDTMLENGLWLAKQIDSQIESI